MAWSMECCGNAGLASCALDTPVLLANNVYKIRNYPNEMTVDNVSTCAFTYLTLY
jgi:hypothetical protein